MPDITPAAMKADILSNLESVAEGREKAARRSFNNRRDNIEIAQDLRMLHSQVAAIPDGDPRFAALADIVNEIDAKRPLWSDEGFFDDIGYKHHPQSAKMLLQGMTAHFQRIARRPIEEPEEEYDGVWPPL